MKFYKIYGQVPAWTLIDVKHSIEDMYECICYNYRDNQTTYLIVEVDYKTNCEFPICVISNEETYLKFKEEYKPKIKKKGFDKK